MWFEQLTGFREKSPKQVRNNISINGNVLKSHANNKEFISGELDIPSLAELRSRIGSNDLPSGTLSVREVIADVQDLHVEKENAGSFFQVASQFNLLEMMSPTRTPEHGVDDYEHDPTQGPACAIAAGAGTIYRNYFVKVNGKIGQSADNQIDCLADLGASLGNSDGRLWKMENGYALATKKGLIEITERLASANETERDTLRQKLRIGIHWDTEVTISSSKHIVSQAYCSALPVAYSQHSFQHWAAFAQLVLEASYEATLCAGMLNYSRNGKNTLYLTLIGGGAFGNKIEWIIDALDYALNRYKQIGLDVVIVSRGYSNQYVQALIQRWQ